MLVLVLLLVATNVATLALLWRAHRRHVDPADTAVESALAPARPSGVTGRTRRVISIEIMNPIELAGARGRMAGIAGSLAPELTRRFVYDRTLKTLRTQLREQHVVADVRLHTLRPEPQRPARVEPAAAPAYGDTVEVIDGPLDDQPA